VSEKSYQLEIFSDLDLLPEAEEFLENIAKETDFDKTVINNLLLSVNEAVSNAMLHGNKSDINKKVTIYVVRNNNELKISVKDQGNGFDPARVPDPTKADNIFKENGRGLYIMRTCMDNMKYVFHPDGTELQLSLNLKK